MKTEKIKVKTEFQGVAADYALAQGISLHIEETYYGKCLEEAYTAFKCFFTDYRGDVGSVSVEVSDDTDIRSYAYGAVEFWDIFRKNGFEFSPIRPSSL
ncbi:hypothetical protein BKH46_09095 [Helicobacter sp. 12S02634-8]|uniref:hypothetical protein n=1 Tax=Helicobacter sp. 12S02634-8 TaxID=1476199 RepID=UPI000BA5F71A|nr:hypothetical protein [Helicobacter sp. 12S02634-8]PAF46100.1 hypothetical protein BKH46_09095 [Helicobacter sp. 12S02634-8]